MTADDVIALLGLAPLEPEGGWYRETHRGPGRDAQGRSPATAIYYLLTPGTRSALHRLPADEVFHFYAGDPVEMVQLRPGKPGWRGGAGELLLLGPDLAAGQRPQVVVPAGVWQGSVVRPGGAWALLGTTMAPGFEFSNYEPADADALRASHPAWRAWIDRLT